MFSEKRRGRHVRLGSIYYWSLCWVCASATFLAALRWSEDYHLVVLGVLSLGSASIGRAARRRRWHGWVKTHVVAMDLSYIVMLTAFYVGEGKTAAREEPPAHFVLGSPQPHWYAFDSEGSSME
jgi:hypothetical protein